MRVKKSFRLLGISAIFSLLLFSCNYSGGNVSPSNVLEITVTGTFSGNPRNNLRVSLYNTEYDADNNLNSLAEAYTDASGTATFYLVSGGRRYWVRAQALLSKSVRETNRIKSGNNYFHMTIL